MKASPVLRVAPAAKSSSPSDGTGHAVVKSAAVAGALGSTSRSTTNACSAGGDTEAVIWLLPPDSGIEACDSASTTCEFASSSTTATRAVPTGAPPCVAETSTVWSSSPSNTPSSRPVTSVATDAAPEPTPAGSVSVLDAIV